MSDKTYYLWTTGCQMNEADSRRVADELESRGFRAVTDPHQADVVLLNTCVVRDSAEQKAVGRITSLARLKRQRPNATLAVMGCLVGMDPTEVERRFPYVDLFLSPSRPEPLFELLEERQERAAAGLSAAPISAMLPISFGCDHHCTYCIVRQRRGPQASRPPADIYRDARDLVARGARELTLLGQNVDAYGSDLPGRPSLADLLEELHPLDGLLRLRFLTSHPSDMGDEIIAAVARLPKVCEHVDIPVQAGSDAVLRRMARPYTVAHYRSLIERLRQSVPDVSIGTDIIVGFCGESRQDYEQTRALVESLRFNVVHIAPYSVRPGTPAARLPDDVSAEEKEWRRKDLDDLQVGFAAQENASLLGRSVEVLVEERSRDRGRGRTRHNQIVFFTAPGELAGQLVPVRITWSGPWSLIGEPLAPTAPNQDVGASPA